MLMPTIMTISRGIIKRLAFSIPFSTPMITTMAVRRTYMQNHTTGETVWLVKAVKYSSPEARPPSPVRKVTKYLITQPPITQ